jgi:hypothetical protein
MLIVSCSRLNLCGSLLSLFICPRFFLQDNENDAIDEADADVDIVSSDVAEQDSKSDHVDSYSANNSASFVNSLFWFFGFSKKQRSPSATSSTIKLKEVRTISLSCLI